MRVSTRILTLAGLLAGVFAILAGCGGGSGSGAAGPPGGPGPLAQLALRVALTDGPERVSVQEDEVLLLVSSLPYALRVELFAQADTPSVVREIVLEGIGRVSVPGIPPGSYLLVLTGLDSERRAISGFRTNVALEPGRSTEVAATLTPLPSPSPSQTRRWVLTTHYDNAQLSVFLANAATGALTRTRSVAAEAGPWDIAWAPGQRFFTVTNNDADTVSVFRFDPSDGSALPAAPPVFSGDGPLGQAFHPAGPFLYVVNQNDSTLSAFRFDSASGALTPLAPATYAVPGSSSLAEAVVVGDFLYASDPFGGPALLYAFAIDPLTGALTPLAAPPPAGSPLNMAFDGVSDLFFVSLFAAAPSGGVDIFRRNPTTGSLARTATQLFGDGTCGVLADAARFFAAGEIDQTLYSFLIDGNGGTIASVDTAVLGPSGSGSCKMAMAPTGDFLYVANLGSHLPPQTITVPGSVAAVAVDAGGNLTPVAGSPFSAETSAGAGDNRNVHGLILGDFVVP